MKPKLLTAGPLAAGLLLLAATGAAGQNEVPNYFTGTTTVDGEACTESPTWNECPLVFESTDARLSGEGVTRNHGAPMPAQPEGLVIPVTQTIRVANDDGAWVGGGTLYAVVGWPEQPVGTDELTWILRGEDAYEGLTAVLMSKFAEGTFSGVLFEGDIPEAPPVPGS